MYNSHSFLTEHTFLIATAATETMAPLIFRAPWGHCTTQRIQETHFFPSVFCGSSRLIAWAGHWAAHAPHRIHSFPALGTKPAPPAFLYGRLPGIAGDDSSWLLLNFSQIVREKFRSVSVSFVSGRPAAYWCMMECSAMAVTAAKTRNPCFSAISCTSTRVSS